MVSIFQQLFQFRDGIWVENYLKRHERSIKATGLLFEYLDLAELDKNSALGSKPTRTLLKIVAQRASKHSMSRSRDHMKVYCWTCCIAMFWQQSQAGDWRAGFNHVRGLGLIREDSDGERASSNELTELFGYANDRRHSERS
jgi:hypothetical protein